MSQTLDSMMLIYESEATIFDAKAAAELKDFEMIITANKEFPQWCKRVYASTTDDDYTCTTSKRNQDLSPLKFLYASEFDAAKARSVIESLKIDKRLSDYKMMSRCLEFPPPNPFILNGQVVPEEQALATWEHTCDPTCLKSTTPAMEACSLSYVDKEAARKLSQDISYIMSKWDGSGEAPASDMDTLAEFVAWMMKLQTRAPFVNFHLDKDFDTSNLVCKWSRASISFGGPLPNLLADGSREFNSTSKLETSAERSQNDLLIKWVKSKLLPDLDKAAKTNYSPSVDMIYFMGSISFEVILDLLTLDALRAIISVLMVFIYIWLTTGSLFLAAVGMSQIILSLPVAWFVMRLVLRIQYFAFFNAMTIFIVCAIGADDIFVFMDAYLQSKFQGAEVNHDFETRMTWVFRKSGSAMLITSSTTCAAFVTCLATPIPGTQSFGVFAALVIAIDYMLVMSLFCCAVMVYHHRFERPALCGCKIPGVGKPCGCCVENCDMRPTHPSPTEEALAASVNTESQQQADPVEHFFRTKFAPFILNSRTRVAIALFAIIWLIPAIIFTLQLKPTQKQEQFLKDDHPLQKSLSAMNEQFGVSSQEEGLNIFFTWGLKDVDRNGANLLTNLTYIGEPVFNSGFRFTPQCMDKVLSFL